MSEPQTPSVGAAPQEAALGVSGRLARAFQTNPLTPVLALAALLLGLVAVMITPREEEPQTDVRWPTSSCPSRARRRTMSNRWSAYRCSRSSPRSRA